MIGDGHLVACVCLGSRCAVVVALSSLLPKKMVPDWIAVAMALIGYGSGECVCVSGIGRM